MAGHHEHDVATATNATSAAEPLPEGTQHEPPPDPPPIPSPQPVPVPIMDPARNSGERNSRFIEPPMREYTPAHSEFDEDDDLDEDIAEEADVTSMRVFLRALDALMHLAVCVLLLAVMAQFLAVWRGGYLRTMTWVTTCSPSSGRGGVGW
jgi:hypothetical protein